MRTARRLLYLFGQKRDYANYHAQRVLADGGVIPNYDKLREATRFLTRRSMQDYALIADPAITGYKLGATNSQVSKVYSLFPESDLLQPTGGSQSLILPHKEGENYWSNQGVNGNYVSTPDAPINRITGDIDISAKISNWDSTAGRSIIAKEGSSNTRSYRFATVSGSRNLQLLIALDGSAFTTIETSVAIPNLASDIWVRVTRVATTGDVKFYTSPNGIAWTQQGVTKSSTIGNLFNSSSPVEVGSVFNGSTLTAKGNIYKAQIYNGIRENGGTLAVNFDANDFRKANPTDQTGWNATGTGERWTINTDSTATGYKGQLVDRTVMQMDGVDDNLKTNAMVLNQPVSMNVVANVFNEILPLRRLYDGLQNANAFDFEGSSVILQNIGGVSLKKSGSNAYKRFIAYCNIHNGANSIISSNGVVLATGDSGVSSPNGFTIGGHRTGGTNINASYSTIIATRTADNAGQRSEMQSFINNLHKQLY